MNDESENDRGNHLTGKKFWLCQPHLRLWRHSRVLLVGCPAGKAVIMRCRRTSLTCAKILLKVELLLLHQNSSASSAQRRRGGGVG